MKVICVDWAAIPRQSHLNILRSVRLGEYVERLPYNTGGSLSYKIPIPTHTVVAEVNPELTIETDYIEFRRHRGNFRGKDYQYVWERIG